MVVKIKLEDGILFVEQDGIERQVPLADVEGAYKLNPLLVRSAEGWTTFRFSFAGVVEEYDPYNSAGAEWSTLAVGGCMYETLEKAGLVCPYPQKGGDSQ